MVKASRYTTLALAALLLAAACTQQEPGFTYRDDPDAVRISAQVGNGEGSPVTRSTPVSEIPEEQAAFKAGDRISVTADGQPEVVYTYDGSSWTPQEDKFLKWNTPTMNFTAWYPVAEGVNADNFTVPADQSDEAKIAAADYMTCSKQITRDGDNPVSLNFERRMARIVVIPSFNNQFNSVDYTVSEITVCGNTNGYASGSPVSGSVEVKAYNNNGTFYALLSPTSASNETFIKVKVKKNYGSEEYSLEAKGIIATEAGKSYIVNLTVGKNVASVSGVTVSDWSFKDSITGSEANQIPYLTFSAANEQTFTMDFDANHCPEPFMLPTGEYFEYSVGGGKWVPFTSTVSVDFGGTLGNLRLRGTSSYGTASGYNYTPLSIIKFVYDTPVACTGDIRTLVDYKNYANANTENARFCCLFQDCKQLTSAPDLPAPKLAEYCYASMFKGCDRLTEAPDLPAKNLAESCYYSMFEGCEKLTKAPELPAIGLIRHCYHSMFKDCRSLTKAPELPAKQLAEYCYGNMFEDCTSLTEAPDLPAMNLAELCYVYMFHRCPLTKAPALPARDLADNCYAYMFSECKSLTKAPELPATILSYECYSYMFSECASLTEAPELPAEQLTGRCYYYMFAGCENLSKVTMKAQDTYTIRNSYECLRGWLEGTGYEQASQSHTLTLANKEVYDCLIKLECIFYWRKKDGATIILLDGSTIDDDPSTE